MRDVRPHRTGVVVDLMEKVRTLPTSAGVYLYKNAEGEVIYVGKARNLRNRVRSYFVESRVHDAKTGSLLREAVDLDYIVVDNEAEALALEDNLIKQKKPRFNILLRDDKSYPYIRLTRERFPRVYVTRRLRKDGSEYFGPWFPAGLAYRLVRFVHKFFLVPSCRVDLTRYHARPCLQYHIHRCLGPCVEGLTTEDRYQQAVRDVRLFLSGRHQDLARSLRQRRDEASAAQHYEEAASWHELLTTVEDLQERQKVAVAEGDDTDIIGYHREDDRVAVNLFHMRRGRMVDRRELFWEGLPEDFGASGEEPADGVPSDELLGSLLKQIYLGQRYTPPLILIPADFEDREPLQQALQEQRGGKVEIAIPQRGAKKAMLDLAQKNAQQSFEQRFRVLQPARKAILDGLQDAFSLEAPPKRIECFDISHFQGAETVASMVVWEDGKMKKSDYRKFRIQTVEGVDDFRSMHEVVTRRYRAVQEEKGTMPSVVLVDGGLGQLHAAQKALEALGLGDQPLASIAKREEIIYVAGQEDEPVILDHHSPVLHVVQMIRDESHRFAITFHRQRREKEGLRSGLLEVEGIGPATVRRLLTHFGSLAGVDAAEKEQLRGVLSERQTDALWMHLHPDAQTGE